MERSTRRISINAFRSSPVRRRDAGSSAVGAISLEKFTGLPGSVAARAPFSEFPGLRSVDHGVRRPDPLHDPARYVSMGARCKSAKILRATRRSRTGDSTRVSTVTALLLSSIEWCRNRPPTGTRIRPTRTVRTGRLTMRTGPAYSRAPASPQPPSPRPRSPRAASLSLSRLQPLDAARRIPRLAREFPPSRFDATSGQGEDQRG